jgi:hypothetical protein
MSSTTAVTFSSIGTSWLGSPSRPMVANTDVSPSRSGIDAPTSEPNTSRRITSVKGIERRPARASCEPNIASSALPVEAEPAWPT